MLRWLPLWLALLPGVAVAQLAGFPPGAFDNTAARAPAPATCAGYSGLGAVGPAAYFHGGMRAYSAATCGTPAANVCNVADVACVDMSTSTTTGILVVTTVGGSDCSIVVCTVKTLYDQSGNSRDLTMSTIANRPQFIVSAPTTGKPAMKFAAASSQRLARAGSDSLATPTLILLMNAPNSGAFQNGFSVGGSTCCVTLSESNAADTVYFYAGSTKTVSATANTWHLMIGMPGDGLVNTWCVDSACNADRWGTTPGGDTIAVGAYVADPTNTPFNGYVAEVEEINGRPSAGQATAINSNSIAVWGY